MRIHTATVQRISDGPFLSNINVPGEAPEWIRVADIPRGPNIQDDLRRIIITVRVYYLMRKPDAQENYIVVEGEKYIPERNTTVLGSQLSELWREILLEANDNEYVLSSTGEEVDRVNALDENGDLVPGVVTKYTFYSQLPTPATPVPTLPFLQAQGQQAVLLEESKVELENRLNVTAISPKVKKI